MTECGFKVGETLFYPNHGTVVIEDVLDRTVKGEQRTYLVLRVIDEGDLVIQVPAANLTLVGVRDALAPDALEKVLDVLASPVPEDHTTNWSHRYKGNLDKVNTGSTLAVAEVVRDLAHREQSIRLSPGERRLNEQAWRMLLAEVALSAGVDEDGARALVEKSLTTESVA